jgi:hypothetical protein
LASRSSAPSGDLQSTIPYQRSPLRLCGFARAYLHLVERVLAQRRKDARISGVRMLSPEEKVGITPRRDKNGFWIWDAAYLE